PFAGAALSASEKLLGARHNPGGVLPMYKKAFARVKKPQGMAPQFAMQSNWFRIGARYARLLEEAGQSAESQRVLKTIGLEG
ncbi:MAG: hypothetical protein ACT4PL_10160, partial [Phycisphaerales bacterium]